MTLLAVGRDALIGVWCGLSTLKLSYSHLFSTFDSNKTKQYNIFFHKMALCCLDTQRTRQLAYTQSGWSLRGLMRDPLA